MRFHVLTIFPALFPGPLAAGVVGRALEAHTISLEVHDVRDYARDPHRQVDDEPFGARFNMIECARCHAWTSFPAAGGPELCAGAGRPPPPEN